MARQGSKCLGTSLNCEQLRKLRDEIGRKRVCVKKVFSLFSCCDSSEQSYSRKTHLALAAFSDKSVTASCTDDIIIFIEVLILFF